MPNPMGMEKSGVLSGTTKQHTTTPKFLHNQRTFGQEISDLSTRIEYQ